MKEFLYIFPLMRVHRVLDQGCRPSQAGTRDRITKLKQIPIDYNRY